MKLFEIITLFFFVIFSVQAAHVHVEWDVVHLTVNRDGYITRGAIGVNGALPIPPVYATVGDTLFLKVHNSLNVSTSIHAHGFFQNGTSYLDGAGMVTQCGIPPGDTFTYEYYLHQAGTFWLHSHYNHQNADGLRTPLIIYDRNKSQLPLQYDKDILLYVEDWFKQEISLRMEQSSDPTAPFPPPASYPYGLINGINANDSIPINFVPGKRYRIRLAHIGSTVWFKFSIAGHKLTVIEADGILSKPLSVDGIDIGPGQRYSVVVQAMDTNKYNYNFTFIQHAEFVAPAPARNPHTYTRLIQYRKGAPIKTIATNSSTDFVWLNDVNLQAFDKLAALPVSRTFNMDVISKQPTDKFPRPELDDYDYETPPLVPTLFTAMTTGDLALNETIYGQNTRARVINAGDVVEIFLSNLINVDHTMHLHGHAFQIIEYGSSW
ncbi:ferroxidase fet3 [Coemansia sp. RSA 2603]|nr:ferroxidase fet3 [Coemansia sp. RSA 2603]